MKDDCTSTACDDLDPQIVADMSDAECTALELDRFECLYDLTVCHIPAAEQLADEYPTGYDPCPGCEHCEPKKSTRAKVASHRIAELDDKLFQYHGIYQMRFGQPWKLLSIVRVAQYSGGSRLVYSAYVGAIN